MEQQQELAAPQEVDARPTVRQLYENFKAQEKTPPDRNEVVYVGKLEPESFEYNKLKDVVPPEQLADGGIQRGKLLDSGFVFINRIGGGEKPIIKTPEFENRTLLTAEELDSVKNSQPLPPSEKELDDIRFDMFSFLIAGQCNPPFRTLGALQNSMPVHDVGWSMGTKEDWGLVEKYWKNEMHAKGLAWNQFFDAREPFLLEECKDIFVPPPPSKNFLSKFVRDIEIYVIDQRSQKIYGTPSPFLDSGFRFGTNPDVTILKGKTSRMNMVTLHLLSRGLNEVGESKGSFDQHYVTLQEYIDSVYPKDPQELQKNHNNEEMLFQSDGKGKEIMLKIQERMIQKAKTWDAQTKEQERANTTLGRLRAMLSKLKR